MTPLKSSTFRKKGARTAGLRDEYIARLEATPYHKPSKEILEFRATLPKPEDLPEISLDDLTSGVHSGEASFIISCFGYVVRRPWEALLIPMNRDVTSWAICRHAGMETKSHDGGGKPPFPLVSAVTPGQLEFTHQCLDYILLCGKLKFQMKPEEIEMALSEKESHLKPVGEIIGFLREFAEQQKKPVEEAFQLPNQQ